MLKKCPYCGRVLPKPRRRLPSGFGQISEIKGKGLAKPFRAMVTVGRKENGRAICKLLKPVSYFATYKEAYAALEEYHRLMGITMKELFRMWFKEWKKTGKYQEEVLATWKLCEAVYEIPALSTTQATNLLKDNNVAPLCGFLPWYAGLKRLPGFFPHILIMSS